MGVNDWISLLVIIGIFIGSILLYFNWDSIFSGTGIGSLGDPFGIKDLANTILNKVPGNQKLGENCQLGVLACGTGLTCYDGKCHSNRGAGKGELCVVATSGTNKGNDIRCGANLTCWPRDGTGGKCYNDPAGVDEFCATTGNDKIKCGDGLTCFTAGKTYGTCKKDWASEGEFCVAAGQDNKIKCREGLTCWPRTSEGGKCYKNRDAIFGGLCIVETTGTSSGNDIRCGSNLTCWPRDGTAGKCYKDPASLGDLCVTTGNNKIKCGDGLSCLPRGVGKCVSNRANKGERCIADHVKCKDPYNCKDKDSDGVGTCK